MKQVEVTILGQSYLLACPEGGEAKLAMAVSAVDREMSAIRDAGRIKARERIAVLAALNIAYQQVERPAAGAGASHARQRWAADPSTSAASDAQSSHESLELDVLLRRLDDALAGDGRLL
jgi:cell division protein ZapA